MPRWANGRGIRRCRSRPTSAYSRPRREHLPAVARLMLVSCWRLPCDKRTRLRDLSQSHSSVDWPRPCGGVIFEKRLLPRNVDGEFAVADAAGKALDEFGHRVLAIGADELGKGRKQARLCQAVAVDA